MSALSDFVLDLYRLNGALVEPAGYGLYDVLLPDALAAELDLPAFQRLSFDQPEVPDADVVYLSQGHPWVDRLVEWMHRSPAPARVYINTVRLEKQDLAEVARRALGFPNARLTEDPMATQARVLGHYVHFTFKVTLVTDEKHEHLVSVLLDAQNGWPVSAAAILRQAPLEDKPAFAHLSSAAPRWIAAESSLVPTALDGLLQRARTAVLAEMAEVLDAVRRRSTRYLGLDQARLEQYYDDLARDLQRRLQRSDDERRPALQDKLAAVQAERERKLADAEARYRLRIDLELITAQVIVQPKLILPMRIKNRNASVERFVVWDPLMHEVEPLACDVCGQPGRTLYLCTEGHLAHERCLLEEQCVDCKRVYCRLCREQMGVCAVCGRATCLRSLNHCSRCGRSTCREHVGLCHAADGAPASLAAPSPESEAAPAQPPAPRPEKPHPTPPPRAPQARPSQPKARPAKHQGPLLRVEVQMRPDQPAMAAFVVVPKQRNLALRVWTLTPQGIGVQCDCEKGKQCPVNGRVFRPSTAAEIEALLQALIRQLCEEYDVPPERLSYSSVMADGVYPEPRLIVNRAWKDERALELALTGWQALYDRHHPQPALGAYSAPPWSQPPRLDPAERAEAERLVEVACGLLTLEGVLKREELYARLAALLHPGSWYTLQTLMALLANDPRFKVLYSGLVAIASVRNVQIIAKRKARSPLPPLAADVQDLLAAREAGMPSSEEMAQQEAEIRRVYPELRPGEMREMIRNAESPRELAQKLTQGYIALMTDPSAVAELVEKLWARTTRWELRGRTPGESSHS